VADSGGVGVKSWTDLVLPRSRNGRISKRTLRSGGQRIGMRAREHMPLGHEYEAWLPQEPRRYSSTERDLRAAVLERAVLDAQWHDQEAIRWIHGLVPSSPSFSCEEICDLLDMPIDRLRNMIPRPRRVEDDREALGRSLACHRPGGD